MQLNYFPGILYQPKLNQAPTYLKSAYWRIISALRFVGQALDASASQLQEAITAKAAGFWVKSVFYIACLPPAPSAGVSVTLSVCRNGNRAQGGSIRWRGVQIKTCTKEHEKD